MVWYYKPKHEHLKNIYKLCEFVCEEMHTEVTEMLSKPSPLKIVLELYREYEMMKEVKKNIDDQIILTKEQYRLLKEQEPRVKNWFTVLKVVE